LPYLLVQLRIAGILSVPTFSCICRPRRMLPEIDSLSDCAIAPYMVIINSLSGGREFNIFFFKKDPDPKLPENARIVDAVKRVAGEAAGWTL
ncbi:MAG: hypothetical protein V8T00_02735, partial [Oscillospiraceae bacterium]